MSRARARSGAEPHSDGATPEPFRTPKGATQHPAAMLYGTGHIVVYGNPPFEALFGAPFLGFRPRRRSSTCRAPHSS